jgi:hypothetical protein
MSSTFLKAFDFDKPKESVDVILKRFKTSFALDDELVSYFKERAAIEDRYSVSPSNLVRARQTEQEDAE